MGKISRKLGHLRHRVKSNLKGVTMWIWRSFKTNSSDVVHVLLSFNKGRYDRNLCLNKSEKIQKA